jgi:predicted NBD/HSP70 family sugar kinase
MAGPSGELPLRPREMRDRNRALVLDTVARHEPITRAQLAARTGLTKSSVSSIVGELLSARLVVEQGAQRGGGDPGRPGTALTLARDGMAGLGLEVNVDYLAACVVDLARRTRVQYVEVGDNRVRDPAAVVEQLVRLGGAAVAAAATQGLTISATCVAVPGLVDQETGTVVRAPNLDWTGVPLRRHLAGRVPSAGTPVLVENEANVAALGELWFGDGAALGDYVHISGEVGVGAGIVVAGQLFRGAHGHAGELGHTTLEPDGEACTCGGRGCLELFSGQEAMLKMAGLDPAVSTSTGRADGPVSVLVDRLADGDRRALAACQVAGRSLGMATASLVKLVDPDTVVLGGIYAVLAPWLRAPFQAALLDGIPMTRAAPPRVAISALGPDAAARGAAGLVTADMLARPGALMSAPARA